MSGWEQRLKEESDDGRDGEPWGVHMYFSVVQLREEERKKKKLTYTQMIMMHKPHTYILTSRTSLSLSS